jgi:hypothetical protein
MTPPSPKIDPNEDLRCCASVEEVSRGSGVANPAGDSSAKSSQVKSSQQGGSDNTLNILPLGEIEVGMSTFINTFCNYHTFDSFESTRNGELQPLIYSEFQFRGESFTCGKRDDAEGANNRKPNSSCTQRCREYTFTQEGENQKIRLIDTPGIANTNGFTRDEQTMKDIVSCLSKYEVLHAICIFLKPNEVRLTPVLKYCIVQLLALLHKDATSNIVFCFTHSSPSMFEAGALSICSGMCCPSHHKPRLSSLMRIVRTILTSKGSDT